MKTLRWLVGPSFVDGLAPMWVDILTLLLGYGFFFFLLISACGR